MTSPLEDLLRVTLDRLQRQEQRTALLEAALLESRPTIPGPRPALDETPAPRAGETVLATRPRREHPDDRPRAPRAEAPSPPSSAVSPVAVLASLDDVVWSVSPDGEFVFFLGGAVERVYGRTEHQFTDGRARWLDAAPPDDRDRLRAALARLPDAGSFTLEHRVSHAAGGFRWVVTRGKLVRDRDGRPLRVDGSSADVTRPARARNSIFDVLNGVGPATGGEFLAKFAQHLCAACDVRAAIIAEPHAGEPNAVRAVAAWVGGRRAEPFTFPATTSLMRELLSGGRVFAPSAARNRFPADSLLLQLRAEAFVAEPLIDSGGRLLGFLALADDRPFTAETDPRAVVKALAPRAAVELARAREDADRPGLGAKLAEAERRADEAEVVLRGAANLAAVGRMASGLAHDFNNLLGVIAGNADLIRETLPEGDSRRETADVIARTAQSVAAMNRKLLSVGRPGPARASPLDTAAAIRTLEPMLRRLIGKRVAFDLDLASGVPLISADSTQFDRVLLNLVLNARDAIEAAVKPGPAGDRPRSPAEAAVKPGPAGDRPRAPTDATLANTGVICVRATTATVELNRPGWPAECAPGPYAAITVCDDGCGMSAEVRAKMFDRYFTTKGDRGTGLGLATVLEIVSAARGHIEVESDPAWGTQVRVYWPALAEPPVLRVMG